MDWLERQAATRPDAPALVSAGAALSWRQLAAAAAHGAERLEGLGIRPGATLLWEASATLPALCWFHAALWAGATVAPYRPAADPTATRALAARVRAAGILSDDGNPDGPGGCFGVPIDPLPTAGAPVRPAAPTDPERFVTLMQTSGSGGPAKLVPLRARHHAASVRAIARRLELSADDRWLVCLPLHHIGGLAIVLRAALIGASVHLHRRFDADLLAAALAGDAITHLSLVPTMLTRLVDRLDGPPPPALRCVLVGGASSDPVLLQRARSSGLPVVPTWGMTEAGSQLATPNLNEAAAMNFTAMPGMVGPVLDGVELRPADGREGELEVRAPMLFEGYVDSPGGPDADGWFATGDRGCVDAGGRVCVAGRLGDRIISGGENVDALAVERALRGAGLVDEVAIIGLPDDEWGERVVAVVVSDRTGADLTAWARVQLEPHQRPRRWKFVDRLPRTDAGKPDRVALVKLVVEP